MTERPMFKNVKNHLDGMSAFSHNLFNSAGTDTLLFPFFLFEMKGLL